MAIYRTGTASLSATGVIIGVGTNWQDKLSLVRVGATMIFQTSPMTICTITSIVSATEMRATATDGATVPAGTKYVILLHDSITVDGLAQDVAETLRYYQSKETVLEDAIEFFQNFDWERIVNVGNQVKVDAKTASDAADSATASKNAAAGSANAAAASQAAAKTSETNAKTSETNAASSRNAAANSATAAKTSETNSKASETAAKTSETNAKTSETNANNSRTDAAGSATQAGTSATAAAASAGAAKTSETNAKTSETNANASRVAAAGSQSAAAGSATTATQQADRAKTEADRAASANPDNQLKKDQNLADVPNKATARTNLELNRFQQFAAAGETRMVSANGKSLFVKDGGEWGVWDSAASSGVALGYSYGGTGATSLEGARSNLGVDRFVNRDADNTFIFAGDAVSEMRLTLNDAGWWGMYNGKTSSWMSLPVYAGGTGGGNKPTAAASLGFSYLNGGSIGKTGNLNDYTGPNGSAGEIYNVAATNTNTVANWPVNYAGARAYGWGALVNHKFHLSNGSAVQWYFGDVGSGEVYSRIKYSGAEFRDWVQYWTTKNTTIDANGFIKRASPIVKIFGGGDFEINAESEGATVQRIGVGVYRISGVLGMNSDRSWGGNGGGIEIPKDVNSQPRLWVDYEIEATGEIVIKTYHRTFPDSPAFARNIVAGYENGDPIDIPSDVFVSVRVEMPEDSAYNLELKRIESERESEVIEE